MLESQRVLLWRANDQSTRDNSLYRNIMSLGSGATMVAAGGKFGGGAYSGNGAETALAQTTHHARQRMGTEDFYISAWVKPGGNNGTNTRQIVLGKAVSGGQQFYFGFNNGYTQLEFWHSPTDGSGGSIVGLTPAVSISVGTWYHIAASRKAGTLRLFLDGTEIASASRPTTYNNSTANLAVGGMLVTSFNYPFKGLINDVQYIVGDYVHDADFTPETDYIVSPVLTAYAREDSDSKPLFTESYPVSVGKVNGQRRTHAIDFFGAHRIYGTVKLDDEPTDIPWKRRVVLFREPSLVPLAVTWSDPVTGEFAFNNISNRYKYTVVSFDYEHNYRAVVADNLTPSPMP